MTMNWPQITIIVLSAIGVGIHMAKQGQPRTDKYSAPWMLAASASEMWILYSGGFFG